MKNIYIIIAFVCCFAVKASIHSTIENSLVERLNKSESFKKHLGNTMKVAALHLIDDKFVTDDERTALNQAKSSSLKDLEISRFKLMLDFPELNNYSKEQLETIAQNTVSMPSELAVYYQSTFNCILKSLRAWVVCAVGTVISVWAGAWTLCMVAAVAVEITGLVFNPEFLPVALDLLLLEARGCYAAASAIESLTPVNVGAGCGLATMVYIETKCLN